MIPAFDGIAIEDITTDDIQRLFNGIAGAKATKEKAKMVLKMCWGGVELKCNLTSVVFGGF